MSETAAHDGNFKHALLAHDSTGHETVRLKATANGELLTSAAGTYGAASASGVNTDTVITGSNWDGDTYTGAGEQLEYEYVTVSLQVDEAGTLFFDFSVDGTNWSSFPVAGFSVASGIHEYHSAHKSLFRYFRPRFVGVDGSRTYFRLYTGYTNTQVMLNSPLSQGVSSDQDASTVKAILHGEDINSPGSFIQGAMASDGGIRTSIVSSLISWAYDAVDLTEVDSITERWDYFSGGLAGTRVAYITNVYSDSSKLVLISSERTLV